MQLRRALALLVVVCAALVGGSAPASASAPTTVLSAVANADGTSTLHWTLSGTSDSINVLPHLRCAADPTATGLFAGSKVPCLWLVDHKAPLSVGPDGCPATGQTYASWRCDMRRFRDVVIDGSAAGQSSLIMFNTKAAGGSGICAWIPLAVRVGTGTGVVQAADGCPERIVCASAYAGTVTVDAFDLATGCKRVVRTGTTTTTSSSGGSAVDLSKCPGATSGKKGMSPLFSVQTDPRGKRGAVIRVQMRRAVPITVEIRVKTSSGSKVVRSINRCAKAGKNAISVPDETGGAKARRRYRVIVRSANSAYPLISSYETLPR